MRRRSWEADDGDVVVFRVVAASLAERAYSGEDAREKGGRWSDPGDAVVYAAGSLALAALEALVHLEPEARRRRYAAVPARIPASLAIARCTRPPPRWDVRPPRRATRRVGGRWLRAGRSAVLCVPSAVLPVERNYLLAPEHPEFRHIEVLAPLPFRFDPRLFAARAK